VPQINVMLEPAKAFLIQLVTFLPIFFLAIAVLVIGWLLAKFLQFIVVRGLKAVNFNVVTEKAGIDSFFKQGGIKKTTIDVLGILIYWLTILVALLVAFNVLGLRDVSELFKQVAFFIPNVIVAVLIIAIGLYFARFFSDAIVAYAKNVGIEDADLMGRVTRYAIMIFVITIALAQVNVGADIIRWTFFILFAGIVLALALAFGLGGQKWAAGQLEKFAKGDKKK
jgi:Mechanosensitive ion channel, conserved TM helix